MRTRILIAEDDTKQAGFVRDFLELEGHQTVVVRDGQAAIEAVRRHQPDLVVLDLMLPGIDGLDVCRTLRSESDGPGPDVPVIMLTARGTEDDLLLGFSVGADDYITKPYRARELAARVRAVLRRSERERSDELTGAAEAYRVADLVVDIARHQVRMAGRVVRTTPGEFELLACLAAAPGRVFTREALLARVSPVGRDSTARAIDMHVMNLRRKLEPVPTVPRYLVAVYGVGYKLAEPEPDEGADAR